MIIIFAGSIGRFPIGGHAWVNLQYLAGLRALGHDVFYLEECGEEAWVYRWEADESTTDLNYPVNYLRRCLELIGFRHDRWIYRVGDRSVGMAPHAFRDVCSQADLLIVRAVPLALWRPEYRWPRRRAFIDVDPGFTQVSLANGDKRIAETVAHCERLFTIAQRIGAADCLIPTLGRTWLATVAPVWLPGWPAVEGAAPPEFTAVLQWRSYQEGHSYRKLVYGGVSYGQKKEEFTAFLDLPRVTSQRFRLALTGGYPRRLAEHGWRVVEGWVATRTPCSYRDFIQRSRAEFGVAKHGYVVTQGGWFSDRSVCYLASGRPVLVQDTGLSDWLPTGEGLLAFRNFAEALAGVEAINADYDRHRRKARQLAVYSFAAERVLPPFLEHAIG